MIVGILGSGYGKKMLIECEKRKIPAYPSVSRTVKSMSALHQRGVYLDGLKAKPEAAKASESKAIISANSAEPCDIIKSAPNKFVEEYEVKQILKHYGIKVPDSKVFTDLPKDVKFNFPVVLKVSDPNILHKTDVGGVALGIKTIEELREKFDAMKKKFPTSRFIVESMEKSGVEVIIGLMRDPNFGLSIMFGLGGIYTELYKDVTFRTLPISAKDADEMVSEIKAHRIFEGFRNIKASKEALIDLLLKVSAMGVDLESQIAQLDLNPVFVRESDAVAVDAKIIKN
jgi:acetyl-CoA synthetase (ADP-forming)